MTMVRGGDDRDLSDIVAMGAARAEPFRFHLDRDRDLVQFAIARKRLLAGLGAPGARALHFFIAEEGASAVAYVVISVQGSAWTIEEAGDRDPTGARVGAILQALIAREPAEQRPSIRALAAARLPAAAGHHRRRETVSGRDDDPSAERSTARRIAARAKGRLLLARRPFLTFIGKHEYRRTT